MNKVIQYECKRLLWNKIFFGILIICLFLSFSLLHGEILMGVSNTAPFSPWSFGSYLSRWPGRRGVFIKPGVSGAFSWFRGGRGDACPYGMYYGAGCGEPG